ncbi:MAG: T9SS type A sorting domain-containing protein [Candidatus Marinimicrobia bacterium]|nr:T9SS type A sorting domain-containing protein [Candidatus Neomarinimicrobiota bacterium]
MPLATRNLMFFLSLGCLAPLQAQVSNVDFSNQVMPIFASAGCTGSTCHGGGAGGLTITTDAGSTYNNIVGVASSCSGFDYIEPMSTNASYIYRKIIGTQSCGGSRMPASDPAYFDNNTDKLEIIRVWIEEGAFAEASTVALIAPQRPPIPYSLEPNYPNPFNPVTTIYFVLPAASHVRLTVYDLTGRIVTTLVNGVSDAGYRSVIWQGQDDSGQSVPAGVYLYRVTASSLGSGERFSQTRKMVLLK